MAAFDAAEAEEHVAPQQLETLRKALADAEAEGKEVYSVFGAREWVAPESRRSEPREGPRCSPVAYEPSS